MSDAPIIVGVVTYGDGVTRTDLDPVLVLAHTMHTTPDSHVVLLGAGVSMAAGVPTAWDVQMRLIRRVAQMESVELDDALDAPVHWWRERYEVEPRYEAVIEALGATSVERQQMMREFFEPSGMEREQGLKQPTVAHRSIARLVTMGVVRVIITLNFDRLMEAALREVGVEPTLAVTPADIAGLAPLQTTQVLVMHLHGDYLSAGSMLNTADEMGSYPEDVVRFLRRVLEDRGLVAVGWSARYEPALRQVIRSVPPPFTSYWIEPHEFSDQARELATSRRMVFITTDADHGLGRLADAAQALRDGRARHPLSLADAVSTTKRELAGRDVAIGVHDRIATQSTHLRQLPELVGAREAAGSRSEGFSDALLRVENAALTLAGLVATAARWGTEVSDRWWRAEIERFAQPIRNGSGLTAWLALPNVPALMMLRAAQVAATAGGRYGLLLRLLTEGSVFDPYKGRMTSVHGSLDVNSVYVGIAGACLRLFEVLAPVFVEHLLFDELAWVEAWETAELLSLVEATYRRDCHDGFRHLNASKLPDNSAESYERLHRYASTVPVRGNEHIRVEDVGIPSYGPVVGHRLVGDAVQLAALAEVGFCGGDSDSLTHTLDAVNLAIAKRANDLVWRAVLPKLPPEGGFAFEPTYMWLDTGHEPAF